MDRTGLAPADRTMRRSAGWLSGTPPTMYISWHPGPPGRAAPERVERLLPGAGSLPRRRGPVRTAPDRAGDRTAARPPTRAETEKAQPARTAGSTPGHPQRAVSTAAAAASARTSSSAGWSRRGSWSAAVQHPQPGPGHRILRRPARDTAKTGEPVWYGGGKLAADLTLPKLRQPLGRRHPTRARRAGAELTGHERAAIWEHAARTATDAAGQIRDLAAAGTGRRGRRRVGRGRHAARGGRGAGQPGRPRAATAYDRAARLPYGRPPRRTPAGTSLRRAARLCPRPDTPGMTARSLMRRWLRGSRDWPRRSANCGRPSSTAPRPPPRAAPRGPCAAGVAVTRKCRSDDEAIRAGETLAHKAFPGSPQTAPPPPAPSAARGGRPPGGWPRPAARRPGGPGH